MTAAVATGPVPAGLRIGEDFLAVGRAWPHDRRGPDGEELLTIEGRDDQGRIRAAQLHLQRTPDLGWSVLTARIAAPGRDRKLPDLADVAAAGTVVVHRYGKRAVVRRDHDVVKVVRPGRGGDVAELARQGHDLARAAGFDAPAVLGHGRGAVSFGILPGQSLHDLGSHAPLDTWGTWWSRWAEAWPRLARPRATTASATALGPASAALPEHTPVDEVGVLRRWAGLVARFEALPAAQEATLVTAVEETATALVTGRPQDPVVSHRDLHDKQIMAEGDSLGLLDFDTAARAEPALDLANLWVHAGLRVDQGLWPADHGALVGEAVEGAAEALGVDDDRFAVYARATRLRLACIYAFRPRYRKVAIAWAGEAGATDAR